MYADDHQIYTISNNTGRISLFNGGGSGREGGTSSIVRPIIPEVQIFFHSVIQILLNGEPDPFFMFESIFCSCGSDQTQCVAAQFDRSNLGFCQGSVISGNSWKSQISTDFEYHQGTGTSYCLGPRNDQAPLVVAIFSQKGSTIANTVMLFVI